jgi:sodium-dependent phosphate cotransporter
MSSSSAAPSLSQPEPSPASAAPASDAAPRLDQLGAIQRRMLDLLRRTLLGIAGIFFFILGIELMKTTAGALAGTLQPIFSTFEGRPWHSLAFGWLAAYVVLCGSPVAAFTLGLYASSPPPLVDETTAYFMIMGSRLGAAFIVLVIGAIALARGQPREKCLAMGVLSFLVTYSIYIPAILLGWALIRLGALHWFNLTTPTVVLNLIGRIFDPAVAQVIGTTGPILAFLVALVGIYVGLTLFDRAFGRREEKELKSPRIHLYLRRPMLSFVIGALVTLASTSVSLSFGLLVPLYLNGYIDRREIVPYMMGANITTFIDTLIAAFVLGGGLAANIVFIEMASVFLFSILALSRYGAYSNAVDSAYRFIFHKNWALASFIVLLFAVPLFLLFVV